MIYSMFQIFILNVQLEFILFFIFIALLTGEFLILFIYYVKGGFQKENTKSDLNLLILVFNFIYFGLSFINLFIFIISFSILLYWTSYIYVKSEFSNKNDGLLQINWYWLLVFFYMLHFYFKISSSYTLNELIFSSILQMMFILWLYFLFNRYLINKKRAVSFRNKAREELDKRKYEKALNFLKEAVQASNNIIGITKLETQLEIEFKNIETTIKEGNFKNLENLLSETINQKTQILTYFFINSILTFLISFFLIFIF